MMIDATINPDTDEIAAPVAVSAFAHASDWLATPGAEERFFTSPALAATQAMIEAIREGEAVDIDALAAGIGAPRIVAEAFAAFAEWRLNERPNLQ